MDIHVNTVPYPPAFPEERFSPAEERLLWERIALSLIVLAAGIGAYLRLRGLGQWPLATDEYYMAKSIRQILAHGVPRFETGGYYLRGLLYQYLTVPLMKLFRDETAVRLIPLLCNLLTLWPLYAISRRFSRHLFPVLAVALFSLSLWEIEFARFARMYTPFQLLFVAYLYFLIRVVLEERRSDKPWLYLLSFLSIWLYEGAIFLAGLNFFPLLYHRRIYTWRDFAVAAGILVLTALYTFVDFRHLGEPFPFPSALVQAGAGSGSMLHEPVLLIRYVWSGLFWPAGLAVVAGVLLYALWRIATGASSPMGRLYLGGLGALALLNLFGLAAAWLALGALLKHRLAIRTDPLSRRMAGVAVAVPGGYWLAFALAGGAGPLAAAVPLKDAGDMARLFFNYPDFWGNILLPAIKAVPVLALGSFTLIGLRLVLLIGLDWRRTGLVEVLYAVFLLVVLAIAFLKLPFPTTRYIFFLYPLIILLVIEACYSLGGQVQPHRRRAAALTLAAAGAFFTLSEDMDWDHLVHLNSSTYNYRIPYDDFRAQHYYSRWDFRSPAEKINAHFEPGDRVASFVIPIDYYVEHLDYVYADAGRKVFWSISARGGTVERWSNARLLYTEEMLAEILDPALREHTLWLVFPSDRYRWRSRLEEELAASLAGKLFYTAADGRINVYRLEPNR